MSTIDIVVGVVLTALGHGGLLAWQEPHVQLLRGFAAKALLQIVGDAVGIDEMAVHALGHIARRYGIEAVGVDEGVALNHLHTILEGSGAQ